jgi:hypothetical protein
MRNPLFHAALLILLAAALAVPAPAPAAFGEDSEKPAPEFTREGQAVVATLVPRGKSTKVAIRFAALDGRLEDVRGLDFAAVARPGVNHKDFRSALFQVAVGGLAPGAAARVSLRSDCFNSSTRFWAFNAGQPDPWRDSEARSIPHPERVQELLVAVQDGGPLDSDGAADGRVTLVGGPRDSFWGYALGTLFIRFFGIFLVLGVLMLGMLGSSRVFQYLEGRRRTPPPPPRPEAVPAPPPVDPAALTPEKAAAIALALHLHQGLPAAAGPPAAAGAPNANPWPAQGRTLIMDGRQRVFHRPPRAWKGDP